jgi:hypothetical protein
MGVADRAMSSLERRTPWPSRPSLISSDTMGPIMCTPRIRSVFAVGDDLDEPRVSPMRARRPLAVNGKLPAR